MKELQTDERDSLVSKWAEEISRHDKRCERWYERCKKITKRYKDERTGAADERSFKFNALWANIQALQPSLYISLPNPEVDRRFLDQDKVGRVVSEALQRSIKFYLSHEVHQVFRQIVLDYLLVGIGTTWIRYVPKFEGPITEGHELPGEDGLQIEQDAEMDGSITWEDVDIDYVHYRDFGHSEGRVWSEVNAVWRRVFMTREELVERFPEHGESIPLNFGVVDRNNENYSEQKYTENKKAIIYEIWDKTSKKAYWICKDYEKILDEKIDPLGLEGFFPCPRPLYATVTNDSLIPTPDAILYQDQSIELDELSQRIAELNKAIKVAGVYDKNCNGVERILNEGVENQLIPVDSWSMFAEKGGLKGAIDWLPLMEVVNARNELEHAFDITKAKMDEITGMNDIRRGQTDAQETATAQQLKSNYSNVRLRDRQFEVQRFIRDNISIVGEIIASFFQPETIKQVTGLKLFDTAQQKEIIVSQIQQQKQQIAAMQQQAQQQGQQVQPKQPPPIPTEVEDMLAQPSWEEVIYMMRNKAMRNFRIDIETDSTIIIDQGKERESRMTLLHGLTNAMEKLVPIATENPMLAPLIGDMVLFGMRGFTVGRQLEGRVEELIVKLEKTSHNPPPKPPTPDQIKAQSENMKLQASAQSQIASQNHEKEILGLQAQLEQQKAQLSAQSEMAKAEIAAQLAQSEQQSQMAHTKFQNELESQRALQQAQLDARLKEMENQFKIQLESIKQSNKQNYIGI
jgi:hypothetical protein